jgi:hypothetical protein
MTPTDCRGPSSTRAHPSSAVIIASWRDLLAATGAEDVEGLSALVDDDCEPDLWITDTDTGVEVGSGVWATCLDFPFSLAAFWTVVHEVEAEETARIEMNAALIRSAGCPLRLVER